MTARFTYDHGLPFSAKLAENIDDLLNRIDKNFASLIILDGGVGQGKTTLAVHIADYVNQKRKFPPINFKEQMGMGGSDFLKKLRSCYESDLPALIYTEAGDFNKRGSLSKFNAMINRTFETFRAFKILIILDLPRFNVLDNSLFDKDIPRLLLHCQNRGDTYGDFKAYSLYRMMYLRKKMEKLAVKHFAYELENPNFQGHFLNLPVIRSRELDIISTTSKLKILRKSEIEIEGLLNYNQLAIKLQRRERWVKNAVSVLKIKHARIIERIKYFDQDALAILSEHVDKIHSKD